MKANIFFPLVTIALLTVGVARGALCAPDPEQTSGGIRYACAGVSEESRTDPRWSAYPVKLVFAAADGGFLGDVAVTVAGSGGGEIFSAHCLSPWLLVDLPPGKYEVQAVARQSYTQTFPLAVGPGRQKERTTRFAEITD